MESIFKIEFITGIFIIFTINKVTFGARSIEIEKAQMIPSSDLSYLDFGTLRLTKAANRKDLSVSGTIYVLRDLQEPEIDLGYSLYRKSSVSRNFPTTPFITTQRGVCEVLEKENLFYPDLIKVSNLPKPGTCPFARGNYTINNYIFAEDKYRNFPPGEYKLVGIFYKNKKFLCGYEFYATIS